MPGSAEPNSNVELVRTAYRTFWNDEYDAFFDLFTDDFEWIVSDGFPYGGEYRGREAVMTEVFSKIQADWERFTHDLDRLIDGGDTIVAIGEYKGTHGTTGARVHVPMVHVFDIDEGEIQRFQQFTDTAMFQAALPPGEQTIRE